LLLRFFEDHGFFGEQRYICNGGVYAFQKMREYFAIGYLHLLEDFFRKPVTGFSALSLAVQSGPGEQLRARLALCERKSAT
jgi:hypothetical protein